MNALISFIVKVVKLLKVENELSGEDKLNTVTHHEKPPFTSTISFNRRHKHISYGFEVNVGDEVNMWLMPDTDRVNLYAIGSAGGMGLLGSTISSKLSSYLREPQFLFIQTKIIRFDDATVDLYVKMRFDRERVEKITDNHRQKWIDSVNKKYNPKIKWCLRFYSENPINSDFKIDTITKSQIDDFYDKSNEAIWLTDKYGVRIEAENSISSEETTKTLRAVFSGHELIVKSFHKEHPWYYVNVFYIEGLIRHLYNGKTIVGPKKTKLPATICNREFILKP